MAGAREWIVHPLRFPKNAAGPFYTLGSQSEDGTWCGDCLACGLPEQVAPELLAPLDDDNSDTYFVRQPETPKEVEQACDALRSCCVDALRYGGKDPDILRNLPRFLCDHRTSVFGRVVRNRRWRWRWWKKEAR